MFKSLAQIILRGKPKKWIERVDSEGRKIPSYIYTLKLKGISEYFDAKSLWVYEFAGGESIRNADNDNKDQRLHKALDSHRYVGERYNKERKGKEKDLRVFSDVVVWIPKLQWDYSESSGGAELSIMVDQLQNLHKDEFEDQLYQNRPPHYCVMPHPDIAEDEVICQFGLGVFIPGKDDKKKQLAEISLRYQGNGFPFSEWEFIENGRVIKRPAGLYQGQHYFEIAAQHDKTSMLAPVWFEHKSGYLRISLTGGSPNDRLNKGMAKLYSDNEYIKAEEISGFKKGLSFYFSNRKVKNDFISFEILPEARIARQINANDADAATAARNLTIIIDDDIPLIEDSYQLQIKAIALPRLDTNQSNNYSYWQLLFDCNGIVQNTENKNYNEKLRFIAYTEKKGLWYKRPSMDAPKLVKIPQDLECNNHIFCLKNTLLNDNYHAFLELPVTLSYALNNEPSVVGRNNVENEKGICLNILDKPNTLFSKNGTPSLTLNYIHFSGEHFEYVRHNNELRVHHISKSAPMYILDENYRIKEHFVRNSQREATLKLDEYILAGCYLLKFSSHG